MFAGRRGARALLACAALLITAGCGAVLPGIPEPIQETARDRELVTGYFDQNRTAARDGASAQREFLRRTQHPDFRDGACELGEVTLLVEPTLSTLRLDLGWTPATGKAVPRGRAYAVAVFVTARRNGTTVGSQIGSQHVVVLDGAAYGFAPCVRS